MEGTSGTSPELLAFGDAYHRMANAFAGGRRIGLSGPSSVGKSTFARLLAHATGGSVHVEGAREWLRDYHVEAYWEMSQSDVARMQLHILEKYETSTCNIFDRTPIDAVFFAQRAGQALDQHDFERRAVRFARMLDLIVFFPYRSEYLLDDGVRLADPCYQLRCGGFILEKLIEHSLIETTVIFQHHMSPEQNIELIAASL